MAKRLFVLASAAILVAGMSSTALAKGRLHISHKIMDKDQQRLMYDPPASHLNPTTGVRADTTWFGGIDGSGVAVEGGTWDFEDGTLQGWNSLDLTDVHGPDDGSGDLFVRRVTSADFVGSPVDATMNGTGSLWWGAFEDEAQELCWPGGQGYTNGWGLSASKTFTYGGSAEVTVSFDYFTDSETQFDYAYVYTNVGGVLSDPLNSSNWSTPEGWGYSGAVAEGTEIGLPSAPADDSIVIDVSDLPGGALPFDIVFNFQSDPLYSDGLDSFSGFLNSQSGPFGVDDILVQGVALNNNSDFESGTNGWVFTSETPVGNLIKAVALADLDPIGDPCTCPITVDESNTYVMVASALTLGEGPFPHPKRQREQLQSSPAYIGAGSGVEGSTDRLVIWDIWEDTPTSNGVGYNVRMSYYPWTCPETSVVGWTLEPAGDGGFIFTGLGGARCQTSLVNNSGFLPASIDSLKVTYEVLGDCDDFGTPPDACTGPEQTNQSPYWDNIRLGIAGQDVNAPALSADLLYQDAFPSANSLLANATAEVHVFYDNNRADMDVTNANMGDSAVVLAGTDPGTEVYLNFRVYPGPETNTSDPFFSDSRHGGDVIAPNFGRARMDTAEVSTGLILGSYSSYYWPNGQEGITNNKIIPDDVLTPGTTVEYFFSSEFSGIGEVRTLPDTTDSFFFELEVLPGYFEDEGVLMTPCFLYVDAFNAGAQLPIEEKALSVLLGSTVGDDGVTHPNWDRYDYLAASSNVPAPMAREAAGDNGMTKYQSLIYRHILYNTGTFGQEGLRDGDADLLQTWLTTDDFDRWDFDKGLWLSGNGMANILDRSGRIDNNNLLANFVGATVDGGGDSYRSITGDSSVCVRLDPSSVRDFPLSGDSYTSVRGNGCPNLLDFNVVSPIGDTNGNLEYVNQDAGGAVTQFASVSNDQTIDNPANYRVLMDAFSLHFLRSTPDGWTGDDCGDDSAAVLQRTADVFDWMGITGPALCDPLEIIVAVPGGPAGAPSARTLLFQNSPNPFNPRTTVRYQVGEASHVKLRIYDVNGRLVRSLVDGVQDAAQYNVTWDGIADDGAEVSSGVYWARMSTSTGFTASTKMVVLK